MSATLPPARSHALKVTILVFSGSSMMTLSSVIDPLRAANRFSPTPLFSWDIVSLDGNPITLTCGVEIKVDGALAPLAMGALLVVVAGFDHAVYAPTRRLTGLHNLAPRFATICGVEAGTWVLARAGIITHHSVTTHWEDTENLSYAYPNLHVSNERYVIDQNIWTSGGASPAFDMMLHFIRMTAGRTLALDVASVFIYNESNVATDSQASISLGRIEQTEPRLAKAIRIMEASLEDPLSIGEIAQQLKLSVRTLEILSRKFLGVTPGAYYSSLRLQSARRLILDSNASILDISVRCGFNSQSALSRAFRRHYGQSPINLRNSSI